MRFARKKDANHSDVVRAFESSGCSWLNIESPVAGTPDGILGVNGRTELVEIKPDSHLQRHALRPAQEDWAEWWRGSKVHLIRSPMDAFELANLIRMVRR